MTGGEFDKIQFEKRCHVERDTISKSCRSRSFASLRRSHSSSSVSLLSVGVFCSPIMQTDVTVWWDSLAKWGDTAFFSAGGFLLAYTVLVGAETFVNVSAPGWVGGLLSGFGIVAALAGMIGLYPRLAAHVPRLAHVCATILTAAAIAVFGTTMWGVIAELLGKAIAIDLPAPPGVVIGASLGLIALGVFLLSVVVLWTHTPSRLVGGLLLTIVGVNLTYFVAIAMYGAARPAWLNFAITGAHPVLFLIIGYTLPTAPVPTSGSAISSDSTA